MKHVKKIDKKTLTKMCCEKRQLSNREGQGESAREKARKAALRRGQSWLH